MIVNSPDRRRIGFRPRRFDPAALRYSEMEVHPAASCSAWFLSMAAMLVAVAATIVVPAARNAVRGTSEVCRRVRRSLGEMSRGSSYPWMDGGVVDRGMSNDAGTTELAPASTAGVVTGMVAP